MHNFPNFLRNENFEIQLYLIYILNPSYFYKYHLYLYIHYPLHQLKIKLFLSQIFFWWTSPIFELSKTKNININTLKRTKKDPYNSSINCRDLFTPYHSLVEYYTSPNSKTHKNLLFSILRVNILDEFVVLILSLSLTLLGIYRVNVFKNFMELFELKENDTYFRIKEQLMKFKLNDNNENAENKY